MPDDIAQYAHGPYRLLERATEAAELLVGDGTPERPYTLWSVVELFGDGFSYTRRHHGEEEEFGELWVVPTDRADEWTEHKGAEAHQIVDTLGFDNTNKESE